MGASAPVLEVGSGAAQEARQSAASEMLGMRCFTGGEKDRANAFSKSGRFRCEWKFRVWSLGEAERKANFRVQNFRGWRFGGEGLYPLRVKGLAVPLLLGTICTTHQWS